MEPHGSQPGSTDSAGSAGNETRGRGRARRPARGDSLPLDRDWLEREALRYAARWETSGQGVRDLLVRKLRSRCERTGEDPDVVLDQIPRVIERLVARGYVDDQRFAGQLAQRLRRQGRSQAHLRNQLRAKGVSAEIIEDLIRQAAPDDEERAAWRLARKRRLGPYCFDAERREADRHRHLAILGRQGFSFELAERVVDAESTPEDE